MAVVLSSNTHTHTQKVSKATDENEIFFVICEKTKQDFVFALRV